MTNAIAFDKLEVWLRYPRPRPREGWRGGAISGWQLLPKKGMLFPPRMATKQGGAGAFHCSSELQPLHHSFRLLNELLRRKIADDARGYDLFAFPVKKDNRRDSGDVELFPKGF